MLGERSGDKFLHNFKALFNLFGIYNTKKESIPDYETLTYLLKKLQPHKIEEVQIEVIRRLIRQRVLEKYRLLEEYYLIAIDGTRIITISEKTYKKNPERYKHCLRKKIGEDKDGNPRYEYYYYVLAAKLVTSNGLALSILNQFVENENQDVDKQDCELKAFYRLAERLKKFFPQTKICLLFDSLYAGKPTLNLCKKNKWEYIIRFKEGSIPGVYQEFQQLLPHNEENNGRHIVDSKTEQQFCWVNDIEYEGQKLHLLECKETTIINDAAETTTFLWICSIRINHANYKLLSNKGGRYRWIVENQGFNTQKNGGYNLEHEYSKDYNALKCYYFLMQIAHTINQLMEKGNLIKNINKTFGSMKNFYYNLVIVFTWVQVDIDSLNEMLLKPCQIRLDSS